jgi:hypothetical protein
MPRTVLLAVAAIVSGAIAATMAVDEPNDGPAHHHPDVRTLFALYDSDKDGVRCMVSCNPCIANSENHLHSLMQLNARKHAAPHDDQQGVAPSTRQAVLASSSAAFTALLSLEHLSGELARMGVYQPCPFPFTRMHDSMFARVPYPAVVDGTSFTSVSPPLTASF